MPYVGKSQSWGHVLQDAGIDVESIGKLHYRDPSDDVGFDKIHHPMMVKDGLGMVWGSVRAEDKRIKPKSRMLGPDIGTGESSYTQYDREVTQQAIDWLKAKAANADSGRPWCLYVGLVAPHFPLVVPQEFYDIYADVALPAAKLHPRDGHPRHPWIEKQNQQMDSESSFVSEEERLTAMRAYYALCSWVDHNVGRILETLDRAGLSEDTVVIYSSDHGESVGARGLWGKSNFYEESAAIPMIIAGPNVPVSQVETPVSLLDAAATIPSTFGLDMPCSAGVRSLTDVLNAPPEPDRVVFSEYHAVQSVSGGFMLRKGRWKLHHYVGFEPELFDLETDPEELINIAALASHRQLLEDLYAELHKICDPDAVNAQAFADQEALVASHGGLESALKLGPPGATPPPAII